MIKRFLSILLVLALSMTMFVFVASAEETFTITWANDSEGHVYSSTYSPYTLVGTEMTVSPDVDLEEGQEIHWFLNGNDIGTSGLTENGYAENFIFASVDGINAVQAKVMNGDTVVATSNEIAMNFTSLIKSDNNIFTNDLTSLVSTKWYYGSAGDVASFVADPAGSGRNVMKIDQPAGSGFNTDLLRIKAKSNSDYFSSADTGSGFVRIDYSIYAENNADKIDLANVWFYNGTDTTKHNYTLYADNFKTESGTVIAGGALSRRAYLEQDKWVDVSILIDNANKVYDVTVGGVQVTTGRAVCAHTDCNSCYLRTMVIPAPLSKDGNLVYYLKDFSIYKCKPAGISISSTSLGNVKTVAGSKVLINAESTFANADVVYYCNGVEYADNKVKASAGTNTVYAEAIDASGNVLGASEPITFEAYADDFKETYKLATATADANGYIRYGNLFPGITSLSRLYYQSADVNVENLDEGSSFNVIFGSRRGTNNSEIWPRLFSFTSDSITITKSLESNMSTVKETITIPRVAGQNRYNIKTIYDTLYGSYIILLDDVVYSVIDVSAIRDSVPSQGNINRFGFMYLQIPANSTAISNYSVGCSIIRYTVSASTVTADGESEGLDAFPLSGASVKLEFSEEMAEIKKEDIIFEVNGDAINFDFSFDESTNTAIITPLYTFMGREKCKISHENVKTSLGASSQNTPSIEFSSAPPLCAIGQCIADGIIPGESADFTVTVRNSLSDEKDAMILLGIYKDGGLESVVAGEVSWLSAEDGECELELDIPEEFDESEHKIVAYFMYKNSFYIIDSLECQV